MKKCRLFVLFIFCVSLAIAQDASQLIKKVKAKLELVDNYEATGVMKTDIAFIKAPIGKIKIYFKKPNLFKIIDWILLGLCIGFATLSKVHGLYLWASA